ncbi:MAG: 2-phosphosulfolactate phosphatase [Pirellulales bacterium]
MQQLNVHLLPERVSPDTLAGGTAVVIDALRATTTIVYALAAGARAVVPCLTIDEARERAAHLPCGLTLLAGERGGLPIAGFDLGNSPAEFTAQRVGGRYVVLTTTNGTKALLHCRAARRVLVAALANLSAVCAALEEDQRVDIVCAGTDGQATDEDLLVAGAIADRLAAGGGWRLDENAARVCAAWQKLVREVSDEDATARIIRTMSAAPGGRNLKQIGMAGDIEIAAQRDTCPIVAQFDAQTGEIRVLS